MKPVEVYWLEQCEADVPVENHWLSAQERCKLDTLRFTKRRTDWRLGRWAAKLVAAARLNLPGDLASLANIEIRPASSGAPEVFVHNQPAAIGISLSHSAGTAMCATAPAEISLGCDLETIEPRSDAFLSDYFTAREQALVAHAPTADRPLLMTLLWSAKESALKALRVGLRVDTNYLEVKLSRADIPQPAGVSRSSGSIVLPSGPDLWHRLQIVSRDAQQFHGWWRYTDNLVRTVASPAAIPAPVRESVTAAVCAQPSA